MKIKFISDKKQSIIFWIMLWFIQSLLMSGGSQIDFYLVKNVVIVGLQFLVFYINLKWLFPLFFERKRFVIYVLLSIAVIYTAFSLSFILIDSVFYMYYSSFSTQDNFVFTTDFWQILSGSSFYSLVLVCSLVYKLLKTNQENEGLNVELKKQLADNNERDSIIIKEGHKTHILLIDDIYFVKGLKEYVVWHTENKTIIALQTMSSIESNYKEKGLLRVHKSFIVNMKHVSFFESNTLKINNEVIPIGRAYKKNVTDFIQNKKATQS